MGAILVVEVADLVPEKIGVAVLGYHAEGGGCAVGGEEEHGQQEVGYGEGQV